MNSPKYLGVLSMLAIAATVGLSGAGAAEPKEVSTSIDKLPSAAATTLRKQAAGAKILGVSQEKDAGRTVFEARFKTPAGIREVTVDPKGNVVSQETVVPLSVIPEKARQTITSRAAGGKILKLEEVREAGKTTYEALIQNKAKRTEIVVAANGKIVEQEDKTNDPDRD